MGTLVMIVVTVSWAFSDYHNAGGWPTHGFTQSSWPLTTWCAITIAALS